MNWSSIVILVWLFAGIVVTGLGWINVFPPAWGPPLVLVGIFAYVLERSIRDHGMDQRFQTIVDTLARNNETLNRIEGGVTATVITNIAESRHWVDLRSRFWVYNGLWKLPAEDFSETFEQLIRKNGVAWRVLFFAGVTEKERDVARRRYERMRASILVWREQIPDLASNFTVRIVQNLPLPGSTFFLSERDGKPLVRLYVDVLMRSETPRLCFEFPSAAVVNGLQIEFDSVWDTGQVATIDEIVAHASLDAMLQRLQTAV